jgi:PAS domain S-box-containing protein
LIPESSSGPSRTRQRSRKVRIWLIVTLAVVLLAFGMVSFVRRVGAEYPLLGVEWVQSSTGPVAIAVDPHSAAEAAGIIEGDVLLSADGKPVTSALEASEIAWASDPRGAVQLQLHRGGIPVTVEVDPEWLPRSEPYAYLAIVGLAFWVSGVFIALRWPAVRGGAIYSLLALAFYARLTLSHTGQADGFDWVVSWADLLTGALVPALLAHLALVLSKRAIRRRRALAASAYAIAAAALLAAMWLRPEGLGGIYRFTDPLSALSFRERFEPLWLSIAWLLVIGIFARSFTRSSSVLHRSQMRWLLWGLVVGLGPYVTLYAVPWSFGAAGLPNWAQFIAVAPMLLIPAAFTVALGRYRLHDLDLILLRGITEVAALFGVFAVLAAALFILREGISELVPLSRSATRYIGFLVAAVSYPQIRTWVKVGVEKAFYKRRYSYRATLLDWARELNAETDLPSLLTSLRARVRETLDVPEAAVLVRIGTWRFGAIGPDLNAGSLDLDPASIDQLEKETSIAVESGYLQAVPWARYLFALKVKGELRAVLAIAERDPKEEPLTTEDRALIGTLAAHAATAIEAARLVLEVRQRADEIERLHTRQAKILESSAVGLLLLSGDDRIQAWNRALEEIYGLPRDEALGRQLSEVFPLHVVRRIEREAGSDSQAGDSRIFRLGMINKRGNRVVVNLAISFVDGDREVSPARVVTFDDVTERVKLEEQVLRQERLASVGLLAAGVAHEINTPLTGISSYAQMLLEELDDHDPRRRILQKIEAQTRRAAGITSSLLNLARPERTSLEALDLNKTIEGVLQLFNPQVRGRAIRVEVSLDGELPAIPGHRGKLQQVLLNLLINARDAVDEDGLISIASRYRDGRAVVEVSDNGIGIAEDDLPRIFDPFYTTKERGEGTGLGLSISYGIVQELKGDINVESRPGEFTCFRVELPTVRSEQASA